MNNKTKGIIAGIAGITLLAGGSTFALWSDNTTAAGGEIVNGELDVEALDVMTWQDVSGDRTRSPHDIVLADWRMVPGDTIEGTQALDVALLGDNLTAKLSLSNVGVDELADDVSIAYDVTDADGNVLSTSTDLGDVVLNLQAGDAEHPDSALTTVGTTLNNTADLKVVVRVKFDVNATDQMLATSTLDGLSVNLQQFRHAGPAA